MSIEPWKQKSEEVVFNKYGRQVVKRIYLMPNGDEAARATKRIEVMAEYGIELDAQQANAMHYVEGIRDSEYTNQARLMGELAALCHCADTLSARMWYNHPLPESQDPWQGAARVNPIATVWLRVSFSIRVHELVC